MSTDMEKWKNSWNRMAKENAFGAVLSIRQKYSEDEFRASGEVEWGKIAKFLPSECKRIIDIGCGAGRVLEFARRHCETAIGVDISDEMLRITRQRVGSDGYLFRQSLDGIDPASVDFIYTIGVFKHLTIEMVNDYIRGGARVLRPGGVYYIRYYSIPPGQASKAWIDEMADRKNDQNPRTNRVIPKDVMVSMLESNGLRVLHSEDRLIVAERLHRG